MDDRAMNVLVFNSGSSSLKFKLIRMPDERELLRGIVARIGEAESSIRVSGPDGRDDAQGRACRSHGEALTLALSAVEEASLPVHLLGHRIVHGRDLFSGPTRVDDEVMEKLAAIRDLAPLHLPPALMVLEACRERMPDLQHIVCFDTIFYLSMPAKSYLYAVPREWYSKHGVRRFGFHGISHHYVTQCAAEMLDIPIGELKLISAHLGNGASVTAFSGGRVEDTSMGFTPLEGLIMGTRAGYLDPAVLPYMQRRTDMSLERLVEVLNHESGLKAVSGCGRDLRAIMEARASGDGDAALAVEMYVHTLRKYIGGYHFLLSGARAVVLTGGIGENAADLRALLFAGLASLGLDLDPQANRRTVGGRAGVISAPESKVKVLVIPTDEERMIARQAHQLVTL
jgi:acetate kinase